MNIFDIDDILTTIIKFCEDTEKLSLLYVNKRIKGIVISFTLPLNIDMVCNVIARKGYFNLFKWAKDEKFRHTNKTIKIALKYDNLKIAKLLSPKKLIKEHLLVAINHCTDREYVTGMHFKHMGANKTTVHLDYLSSLIRNDYLEIIKTIDIQPKSLIPKLNKAIGESGSIDMFKFFLDKIAIGQDVLIHAIRENKFDLFSWIVKNHKFKDYDRVCMVIQKIEDSRYLDVIIENKKRLTEMLFICCVSHKKYALVEKNLSFMKKISEDAIEIAIAKKDIKMLEILLSFPIIDKSDGMVEVAVEVGNTEILEYLLDNEYPIIIEKACSSALYLENYDVYVYLTNRFGRNFPKVECDIMIDGCYSIFSHIGGRVENRCDRNINSMDDEELFNLKIDLNTLKDMYNAGSDAQEYTTLYVYRLMTSGKESDIDILKQELKNGNMVHMRDCMARMCVYLDNINFLKYIISTGYVPTIKFLECSIKYKRTKIAEFLLTDQNDTFQKKSIKHSTNDPLQLSIKYAIKNGMTETIKIINNILPRSYPYFKYVIINGQFTTLKWICENYIKSDKFCCDCIDTTMPELKKQPDIHKWICDRKKISFSCTNSHFHGLTKTLIPYGRVEYAIKRNIKKTQKYSLFY